MRFYKGDPFWMVAKYSGVCAGCQQSINKGHKIWFYPKGRAAYCAKCGEQKEQDFLSRVRDEEFISGMNW